MNQQITDGVGTMELVQRAAEAAPAVAEHAQETLALKRPADAAIAAIVEAGLPHMTLPTLRGGSQAATTTQLEAYAAIAEADASTSWVACIYNAVGHMICGFGDQALDEFLESEKPYAAGIFAPTGKGRRAEGGYMVSGKYAFASGQHHAGWIFVPMMPEEGGPPIACLIPKEAFEVQDDWHVSGFIGTGSNAVVLGETFVPDHRTIPFMDIVNGNYRESALSGDPYYRQPFVPIMCAVSTGTPLGLARRALKLFRERIATRGITYTSYSKQAEAPITHLQLSEAQAKLDQAEFHAYRLTRTVDQHMTTGAAWDMESRVRCRSDIAWTIRLAREVCEIVEQGSGASAIHLKDAMPAILRDIRTISVHSFLLFNTNAELYGRVLAGMEPDIPFV
ncbi:acyl-CoA dehydrogenase family protein [Celeribacter indicus]|uniref:Acyl-CoA dehydrogenase-like protein n=1 Tax=Celeribacter indicus TaxID=1208324 RepID=A0A0B5DXB5_9RHOB|nr:acyl-CoA dehydrogenase family protein [Celeribacter indicus]AJE44902.1 acyl-CoA dehydrogenase-like protein [Celeribacter indicus]SDW97647.1 Acyl-CoA dehydrogenase [Celeribacter indicus]